MDALLFTVGLALFWGLAGFAILSLFSPGLRVIQGILISPAVGIAVVLLPVYFLSRTGLPVKDFAAYLATAMLCLSALILISTRPLFPLKLLKPFVAILFGAALLVARPMLSYGFDWLSYANDDMANYCLGAARFLHHGFFEEPNLVALHLGRDYSQAYWFLNVGAKVRSGSELMLAFVWGATGFNAHQIFMPIIVGLHLALISAVGGMVCGITRNRKAPVIAMSLMAISPLSSLGVLNQLIGQVGGLAMLVASTALLLRVPRSISPKRMLMGNIPAFLMLTGILIWYPEVIPFLGLGWLLFTAVITWRESAAGLRVLITAGIVGILLLVVLQETAREVLNFMLFQARMAGNSADPATVTFPYMLLPSGIPLMWGMIPMGDVVGEPFLSAAIAIGLFLTYWFLRKLPREVVQASSPAIVSVVMFALGAKLFIGNIDFGLFKLAMFVQPFMAAVIAIRLAPVKFALQIHRPQWLMTGIVVMLCVLSQIAYVEKSTGEFAGSMNQIPHASSKKINKQFVELLNSVKNSSPAGFVADTSHLVLAKFQALYTAGTSFIFPSKQFFQNITGDLTASDKVHVEMGGVANWFRKDKNLTKEELNRRWLLFENDKHVPFNAFTNQASKASQEKYYSALPMNSVRNRLAFIHSDLGIYYYFLPGIEQGDRRNTAFYAIENDPMFSGEAFFGLGRRMMLMVINPTPGARMVMEATTTVMKNFDSELPHPTVYGDSITPVQFIGRGAGRVFSEPVQPMLYDGIPYISLDMGRDSRQFKNSLTGLMFLYGRDISQDTRYMTSFARDISLISEEEYMKLEPPDFVKTFPTDLSNRNLEYSGIYEDGWISENAFFVLAPKASSRRFNIKGLIPKIDKTEFKTVLNMKIDGQQVLKRELGVGMFDIVLPVPNSIGRHRIDLNFDGYQRLPGKDGRPTGGKIDFIGYVD